MPEEPESLAAMAPAFEKHAKEEKYVVAVRPSEVDVRLMVQLTVFSLNGYDQPLDDLDDSDKFLMKCRINKESKKTLREELKHLGIRLSSMFPDLDHLAEETRRLAFRSEESEEAEEADQSEAATPARNAPVKPTWPAPPSRGGERST